MLDPFDHTAWRSPHKRQRLIDSSDAMKGELQNTFIRPEKPTYYRIITILRYLKILY